jgi:hypothetical protein
VLIGEASARLLGFEPLYDVYSKPSKFWVEDPMLGWRHDPGASGTYIGPRPWPVEYRSHVTINSQGLRGPEVRNKSEIHRRILVLGDSIVAGFEVQYEDLFTTLLGEYLTQELQKPVEIINAGVRGYGTDQSYLYYRTKGYQLKSDIVIFNYSVNDPRDNVTLHRMRRPFGKGVFVPRESNGIELVGVPVPRFDSCSAIVLTDDRVHEISGTFSRSVCAIQMSLFDHSSLFSLANLAIRKSPRLLRYFNRLGTLDNRKQDISEAGPVADNFSYEITRRILFHLSETVRSNGAELILMAKSRDLKELQLSEQFLQRVLVVNTDSITNTNDARVTFKKDGHWNPIGHKEAANLLYPVILKNFPM